MPEHETFELFSSDYQATSFWLDGIERRAVEPGPLPAEADVVVIGSGYTGLGAAIQTARGGRETVVLEAGELGQGCSTRNGGHISASVKPGLDELAKRFGLDRARAIRAEGRESLDWIETFIKAEGIDCDFRRSGRFHAAHTPAAFEQLLRSVGQHDQEGIDCFAVMRAEQAAEIKSAFYHGGLVFPHFATLHPGKFHQGLMQSALAAGARVLPQSEARGIRQDRGQFEIETARGTIRARDVVIATNGYTAGLMPWLQRRIIPIGSYVIATEPLPPGTVERLFPTNRLITDSRRVVFYYGPSPDRRRIIFGGRVSAGECDPKVSGPRLHAEMVKIFPELRDVRIARSWQGTVAYTFDELAHSGKHEGVHYAMGYCGSGVGMASYLGMRIGLRVLGRPEGRTAFDDLPFPMRPLYAGKPWFLSTAVAWYRWRDRIDCYLGSRRTESADMNKREEMT